MLFEGPGEKSYSYTFYLLKKKSLKGTLSPTGVSTLVGWMVMVEINVGMLQSQRSFGA